MKFSSVYPCYVTKVEKKGRTKEELNQVITLLSNLENKLQKDISPISDFRGTSEYRNQVINNSFTKLYRLLSNNSEINNIMEVGHG